MDRELPGEFPQARPGEVPGHELPNLTRSQPVLPLPELLDAPLDRWLGPLACIPAAQQAFQWRAEP